MARLLCFAALLSVSTALLPLARRADGPSRTRHGLPLAMTSKDTNSIASLGDVLDGAEERAERLRLLTQLLEDAMAEESAAAGKSTSNPGDGARSKLNSILSAAVERLAAEERGLSAEQKLEAKAAYVRNVTSAYIERASDAASRLCDRIRRLAGVTAQPHGRTFAKSPRHC
eukprot:6189382-Pleurochrysis_carterae.AAC.2